VSNVRAEEGKKTQGRCRGVNQEATDLQVIHPVLTLSFFLCDRGGVIADMLVLESVDRGDPVRRLEERAYIGQFEIAKGGEAGGDLQN
jgi:hypothetical protein